MPGSSTQRRLITDEEVATAVAVLRAAAEDEALSEFLQQAVGLFNRRQKQRRRLKQQVERSAETTTETATVSAVLTPPSAAAAADTDTAGANFVPIQLAAPHLSRPLYANPVCFLATWQPGTRRRNLMTVSWLTAIDNDGHFLLSMNQKRHSATLLMAHPYLVLSVACAGLETLLTRVGGCSGARVDKSAKLGTPLCRPGWAALNGGDEPGATNEPSRVDARLDSGASATDGGSGGGGGGDDGGGSDDGVAATALSTNGHVDALLGPSAPAEASPSLPEAAGRVDGDFELERGRSGAIAAAWPTDGEVALDAATCDVAASCALADAFAVEPGVAHVCARVTHVRGAHGHYLLTCETLKAFVRSDYWSGKTLERRDAALPPILSFVGSQRFGLVVGAAD